MDGGHLYVLNIVTTFATLMKLFATLQNSINQQQAPIQTEYVNFNANKSGRKTIVILLFALRSK